MISETIECIKCGNIQIHENLYEKTKKFTYSGLTILVNYKFYKCNKCNTLFVNEELSKKNFANTETEIKKELNMIRAVSINNTNQYHIMRTFDGKNFSVFCMQNKFDFFNIKEYSTIKENNKLCKKCYDKWLERRSKIYGQ